MPRALTNYEIAWAVGFDEANRRMRAAKRTTWSEDDYGAAIAEFDRVMDELEPKRRVERAQRSA